MRPPLARQNDIADGNNQLPVLNNANPCLSGGPPQLKATAPSDIGIP